MSWSRSESIGTNLDRAVRMMRGETLQATAHRRAGDRMILPARRLLQGYRRRPPQPRGAIVVHIEGRFREVATRPVHERHRLGFVFTSNGFI